MASLHPEKAKSPAAAKSKPDIAIAPAISEPLTKFKELGAKLKRALESSPTKSEDDKPDKIARALFLYKKLYEEIMEEYSLIMVTEFLEASAFEGLKGAVKLEQSEKACCEEMIPIIKEAKQVTVEICRPWSPPKEFWMGLLEWERTTETRYIDVMSRIKSREEATDRLGRKVWKSSVGR